MKFRLLLGSCLLLNALTLQANERWFEVEMIIFERTADSTLKESFPEQVTPIRLGRNLDLLSARVNPDISSLVLALEPCHPAAVTTSPTTLFAPNWQPPQAIMCWQETQPLAWQRPTLFPEYTLNTQGSWPQQIGPRISGTERHETVPYLAAESAFQMTEVAERLRRQRQHQLLLHTVWRQAPVTERRAIPSRWYAGRNYSQQFDYWGQPLTNSTGVVEPPSAVVSGDLLEQIDSRLQQLAAGVPLAQPTENSEEQRRLAQSNANIPEQVWQLDGLFKLHLDHYLFVNTDFNLRQLQEGKLHSINIKQSRRLISGEIHYLDHPKLGIVLQIRRFEPPNAASQPEGTE
jgi:hypothetical protein